MNLNPSVPTRGQVHRADPREQAEVIAFLSDPASYASNGPIDRFETHANLIFLAGSDAWKIKRAVRFPYLDFSTLERRHAACLRELQVNQQFAPDLYLDCVPITRCVPTGRLSFGGGGEVVEWAVHMRRFEQSALLSHVARTSGITPELAKCVADTVLESHRQAERGALASGAGLIKEVLGSLLQSLAQASVFDADDARRFVCGADKQLALAKMTLDEREARGYVRRCHGDIHLANIVLWQGRPLLYDAIEFDETIATIDTLYDLAFLLMDLERHNQRRAANAILNRYLWRSNDDLDLKGLRALPLFLALRAAIRGVVSADRAAQQQGEASKRDSERARSHLQLALQFLATRAPQLIAVGGLSGSGKTTLAARLAPIIGSPPGAVHLRSDLERKTLAGVEEMVHLAPDSYSSDVSRQVYRVLRRRARIALEAGHSVVVDAVYARHDERQAIEAITAELGIPFRGFWLYAEPGRLISRVTARREDASDANASVVQQQLATDVGALTATWTLVDADGSEDDVFSRVSGFLGG